MGFISLPAENVPQYLWTNRPSASSTIGELIYITNVGIGGSYWISNGTYWSPLNGEVTLAQSGDAINLTGFATEQVMATYTLPGGLMSANGQLEIIHFWNVTNSVNNKTVRIRHSAVGGGVVGDTYYSFTQTAIVGIQAITCIRANNSVSAQKGWGIATSVASGIGAIAATLRSFTRDLQNDSDIVFTAGLANTSETVTLEGYSIVYRG